MTAPVAVLLGDLGDERCGVGRSTASLLAGHDVVHLDPTVGSGRGWWRACGDAAARCRGLVIVYPTASTYLRPACFVRALLAAVRFRGRWVRTQLHEYHRYGRRHRPFVAVLAWLGRDGVVVSSEVERRALQRPWPSVLTRRRTISVIPPANGSAPASPPGRRHRTGTAGVFGMPRPDKDVGWIGSAFAALPPGITRLELAGSGWDDTEAPSVAAEVVRLGHVPDADLARLFGRWDVALAPFADGPHDGRLSLRTPLAHGVPTMTSPPAAGALTLALPHLHILRGPTIEPPLDLDVDRDAAAAAVAEFEADARSRLRAALLDEPGATP